MKINVEVVGMKAFKGAIDGKAIDSGTLYARIKMDDRNNVVESEKVNLKAGVAVEEWRMPSSADVVKLRNETLPFHAALEVERMTNGRETKDVCMGVEVVAGLRAMPESVRKVA